MTTKLQEISVELGQKIAEKYYAEDREPGPLGLTDLTKVAAMAFLLGAESMLKHPRVLTEDPDHA